MSLHQGGSPEAQPQHMIKGQGYSKLSLLAIVWGGLLSQALWCASAAFQLLAALLGRARWSWGLRVQVAGYIANLNLHL